MSALLHSGVALVLGGVTYIVPPLSLGTIEKFEAQIEGVESLPRIAQLRLTLDLAHAALVRNYPEMTRSDVADLIDMVNAPRVYAAVMGHSIPTAESSSEGEAGAVASGTGLPSTPTSAPVSAGRSTTAGEMSRSTTSKRSRATGAPTHPSM